MFGQVLEKLDLWVGRSFMLASFFPLLIFIAANVVMAQFMTPDAARYAAWYFTSGLYGPVNATVVGLIAIAALAYVTDPLVGVMTRFLEGAYFPSLVAGWLATDQTRKARDLAIQEEEKGRIRSDIARRKEKIKEELQAARWRGADLRAVRRETLIENADYALKPLERKQDEQRAIRLSELEAAAAPLKKALIENCAGEDYLAPGATQKEVRASRKLYRLFSSMVEILDYALKKSENDHSAIADEKKTSFGSGELPSTEFGNQAAALRGFFETRFKLDFEFFWPIVQIVLQSDQKSVDALTNAKQKLDFCVRTLMYTVLFTAIWLVIATFTAEWSFAVPLIGTGGFLVAALWLEIVHANYRSFSELVRAIVILKRFDVLKALHQKLPATLADEQEAWSRIGTQLRWAPGDDVIVYQHADK